MSEPNDFRFRFEEHSASKIMREAQRPGWVAICVAVPVGEIGMTLATVYLRIEGEQVTKVTLEKPESFTRDFDEPAKPQDAAQAAPEEQRLAVTDRNLKAAIDVVNAFRCQRDLEAVSDDIVPGIAVTEPLQAALYAAADDLHAKLAKWDELREEWYRSQSSCNAKSS